MTIQIKLSSLAIPVEDFVRRVEAFIAALKEYAAHLEGVKLDAANPDLKPEYRRVAFPPPSEEPMVEQAAREGYELAGPTLEEKKAALFAKVRELETSSIHEVLPPHKARHWEFQARDANARKVKGEATEADHATIAATVDRGDRLVAIQRHAAKHEHDISDLTEENVDHYVIGGAFA